MKKLYIFLPAILLVVIIAGAFVWHIFFGETVSRNIKYYQRLTESSEIMPKIEELSGYDDIYFRYYHKNMLFFESDAYTLRVKYSKENYAAQKKMIEDTYVFQAQSVEDRRAGSKRTEFDEDGYVFRTLSFSDYDLKYPKDIVFIGASDRRGEIVYIYYHDGDLDYIDEPFDDFLEEECGWDVD